MHEDVALVFAQWLSPEFYLWCNDRVKELLTQGVSTIANDDETILHAMQVLQRRVEESRKRQQELETTNAVLTTSLAECAPKVAFADSVAGSNNSILVGELAKIIAQKGVAIGQNRMFEWLREKGYTMQRKGCRNFPTQRSIQQGLMEIVERTITSPDGGQKTTFTTKITGKGQVYFVDKFLSH